MSCDIIREKIVSNGPKLAKSKSGGKIRGKDEEEPKSGRVARLCMSALCTTEFKGERIRSDSPHERVTGARKTSLAEKQNPGNPLFSGRRRSTADLYSRPTTADPNAIL